MQMAHLSDLKWDFLRGNNISEFNLGRLVWRRGSQWGWWWRSRLKRRSVFGAQHLILGHTWGQFFARQTSGLTFHGPWDI